jgi:hypothetical protein
MKIFPRLANPIDVRPYAPSAVAYAHPGTVDIAYARIRAEEMK